MSRSDPRIVAEVGGLPDETGVALCLYGDDLDPDTVTRVLCCEPTRAGQKGERSGKRSPRPTGAWILEVRGESEDPETLTAHLLNRLPNDVETWSQLTAKFDVKLCYGIHLETWNRGFELSPAIVTTLGRLGVRIGFDIYAHGNDDV